MTEDEILAALRQDRNLSPVHVAEHLDELLGDDALTDARIVFYFFRAFRDIPLRVLRDAEGWHRVQSSGGISDAEFNALLSPWLGPHHSTQG
jgi:hypothetical protein